MTNANSARQVPGYCALCTSKCGSISVVEDGRFVALKPDPDHPTGKAICGKGRAAPELVYHSDRLLHPMRRTKPKGDADPGWERISWDEALDAVAQELNVIAQQEGPEAVAFGITTPSGTGLQDSYPWIERLRYAFGSPNAVFGTEICNYHRDEIYALTFGVATPIPDFTNTDCIILWGHNPSATWLAYAGRVADAKARGAKLIVIDPRREGLANKADAWLRVRPGSDGALALGLANLLIKSGNIDSDFLRQWTNGPFLLRDSDDTPLPANAVFRGAGPNERVAWDNAANSPVLYDPQSGSYIGRDVSALALIGKFEVIGTDGKTIPCRPAFDHYAALCRDFTPERVAELTWIPVKDLQDAAQIIAAAPAVSCYSWSGVGQHSNASQTSRAIALLYALTGSFDAPGGNVLFETLPLADISGADLLLEEQSEKALGLETRPLGPEAQGWITTEDLYDSILDGEPYAVRGMLSFGTNALLSHADGKRGQEAMKALTFSAHIDMFMTPTAELADIVLPVNTPWEREALSTDFKIGPDAASYIQLRPQVIESLGESKSDLWIAFELAKRLGFANQFWGGDIDSSYRVMLAPSGISLEELRDKPRGLHVAMETRHRKYAEATENGPRGFATPSRRVEIFSQALHDIGQAPFPEYFEPAMGPFSRPDAAMKFSLILTSAKSIHYCHSQHRGLPSLRRHEPDPAVEIHPDAADARGISEGDWVQIKTPHGAVRARAKFKRHLDPRVVSATAGWWQSCADLDLPGFDALESNTANLNAAVGNESSDPISGSVPHRSYLCEVSLLAGG